MGSTDTTAVVTTRRGLARASQVWQDGRHDRTFNVLAPPQRDKKGANQYARAPRRPRPRARVPTLEQMNDQLGNDQPNKNESGPGPASRTPTVAASSSTNDHLEEVLKGQAQQAEFLQHMWVQQSQMQVCALTGAIQQLAQTQQVATAWTSEETRGKTSRGLSEMEALPRDNV